MNPELPAIDATGLSLAYRLELRRTGSIKEFAIWKLKRHVLYRDLWALRDVSFRLYPGERLGLVGPNGSGKSTLIKVLGRVLTPTSGRVRVRGRVAPLIELGAGFNPELTGRENIVLYGAILGRDPGLLRRRAAEIAAWAGVEEFLDSPLRHYSSGMVARLGFAVATDVRPDVLLVDEVFSVGDDSFKRQSTERMAAMIEEGTTVILASHQQDLLRKWSDQVLWLDHGRTVMSGNPESVLDAYARGVDAVAVPA